MAEVEELGVQNPEIDVIKVAGKKSFKDEERERRKKEKRRKRLLKETEKADKRGVCYLSRIPPKMDPLKLRQILSAYGEIQRIYLAPENPEAQMRRKRSGGFRGLEFSEGWVEFADKHIAKKVANMLNGEQMGGKKRSQFFYDIWNIKYLSKFKWDDLTEETTYNNAIRDQKLRMEISAGNKERDFYLNKVDQSRALSEIEKRMVKKRKLQNSLDSEGPKEQQKPKVIRPFPQKKPLAETAFKNRPTLSKAVMAEIFNSGNDES
ncbi:pre-rRNA-processing protein ESF2-like isoform X1 [Chenopodium quinoa]|uniref:pre-rRNA-processing protein ESF2-like isoform X1 n=1 Tax=Chenopodium quinoa TaxID=63459 RepID=UPI000B77FF85|nr:pre-rRNA-processing protein ESF2-like isoform X1 [Chenopodium quinoa]XP_021724386.1 pre-rRNA-processing protein ESF2-like isoform X1 [Chenopodium quinoa]